MRKGEVQGRREGDKKGNEGQGGKEGREMVIPVLLFPSSSPELRSHYVDLTEVTTDKSHTTDITDYN